MTPANNSSGQLRKGPGRHSGNMTVGVSEVPEPTAADQRFGDNATARPPNSDALLHPQMLHALMHIACTHANHCQNRSIALSWHKPFLAPRCSIGAYTRKRSSECCEPGRTWRMQMRCTIGRVPPWRNSPGPDAAHLSLLPAFLASMAHSVFNWNRYDELMMSYTCPRLSHSSWLSSSPTYSPCIASTSVAHIPDDRGAILCTAKAQWTTIEHISPQ